ncbi:MAG: hypothetical protein OEN02_03915 [Gammaproteobacteria bacterium]|nr:hypothetical protein [Gammaproteobacteria bacterium]MDH3534688.1 hypothetical protein [Gammaproteobacteria bacterium]
MQAPRVKQQAGYALILMVLALMGVGGVVIAGFTQGAKQELDQQRYQRNQRVLKEAKQALLMYAYRYPEIALDTGPSIRGPGRLPCPDINDSGTPNTFNNCEQVAGTGTVGRFPWDADGMDFYDIRDASGARLWYAVSQDFNHFDAADIINSDTLGTITIFDQSGAIAYDGAANGVAAVIIAPGPPIALDEDNNGTYEYNQVRGTFFQRTDPRNYLDTYNGFVNSAFVNNGNADSEGFILGPVREDDPNSPAFNTFVINDQVAVITVEELTAVAEKAVFQAYREALDQYRTNIGANRYPWLDPYDSDDGLATFDAVITPAAPNPVIGRMPSIFANYFDNANLVPSQALRPELRLSINIEGEIHNLTIPPPPLDDVFFEANSDLNSSIDDGYTITRFFWDGHNDPMKEDPLSPKDDIWEVCPIVTNDEEDCNRDTSGNFMGTSDSDVWLRVRQVTITFNGGGGPLTFAFGDRVDPAPTGIEFWQSSPENPDPQNHVYIAVEYDDGPAGVPYISSFTWSQDDDFQASFAETPAGNNDNGLYNYDAGDTIKVGLPYYPVLPSWLLDNDWHNRVLVAYSSALQPGGDGSCTAGVDDCLTLLNIGGIPNDKTGLIVLSGADINGDVDLGLVDGLDDAAQAPNGDSLGVGFGAPLHFSDDLADIFEGENNTLDLIFDSRPAGSNDTVLLLE